MMAKTADIASLGNDGQRIDLPDAGNLAQLLIIGALR
jgi:hypothetical protein